MFIGLVYQNEILQATCDCNLLLEDKQIFLITFKVSCINEGISERLTENYIKIAFLLIHPM